VVRFKRLTFSKTRDESSENKREEREGLNCKNVQASLISYFQCLTCCETSRIWVFGANVIHSESLTFGKRRGESEENNHQSWRQLGKTSALGEIILIWNRHIQISGRHGCTLKTDDLQGWLTWEEQMSQRRKERGEPEENYRRAHSGG
jgi:hypothetical protein